MINNKSSNPAEKLISTVGKVYEPESREWSYSHHAAITFFKGKFYAFWSNGLINEDDVGQRVMIAESDDGINWANVRPLVLPEIIDKKGVASAAGVFTNDDILNVYFGYYNYDESTLLEDGTRPREDIAHRNVKSGVISSSDGVNWTQPYFLNFKAMGGEPRKTASGRIIMSGGVMFPYTDDPNAIEGYHITGIYGNAFGDEPPCDDSESIHRVSKFNGWDGLICEGSFFQTDDNVIHMMLRSNTERLWCSESTDNGETWSAPEKTEYSDDGSKFHFGRLPDGRFYGVSNAKPYSGRNPLYICVSDDGENFNKSFIIRDEPCEKKYDGLFKGGTYGYPHTLIHDGYMYVIYSKNKESIEVSRFDLSQL